MSQTSRIIHVLFALTSAVLASVSVNAAPIDYDPWCPEVDRTQDPSTVFELKEAHVGGAWWLPRETELGSLLAVPESLRLTDGSGESAELTVLERPTMLVLLVPEGAMVGDSFLLESDLSRDSVVLRVVDDDGFHSPLNVSERVPTVAGPEGDCDVYCFSEGYTVPRAPALDLVYSGGPVALTIEYMPRASSVPERVVVDAYLEHSPAPRSVSFVIGQATLDATASGEARVTFTPVHAPAEEWTEDVAFETLEEVPFEQPEGVDRCDELPRRRSTMGCDSSDGSSADGTLVLAMLGGLFIIRRKRSGGLSC